MKKLCSSVFIIILLIAMAVSSCSAANVNNDTAANTAPVVAAPKIAPAKITAWVAYWDLDGALDEISARQEQIGGISYFAAYFNEDHKLFIPEELTEFHEQVDKLFVARGWASYLTAVNDIRQDEGSLLKNTDILRELFASESSRQAHARELITLAKAGGYDGIDLDYEAIRDDIELWQQYLTFCQHLYTLTQAEGLGLRVILESNTPFEELSFPSGPEYVMMCYNLFGYNEERGPKADDEFLRELIEKMSALPGRKSFALASGGYDWAENSSGKQLTEQQAQKLLPGHGNRAQRDDKSGALNFRYTDSNGVHHEVWYADAETMRHWQSLVSSSGDYGLFLWRIGGNVIKP